MTRLSTIEAKAFFFFERHIFGSYVLYSGHLPSISAKNHRKVTKNASVSFADKISARKRKKMILQVLYHCSGHWPVAVVPLGVAILLSLDRPSGPLSFSGSCVYLHSLANARMAEKKTQKQASYRFLTRDGPSSLGVLKQPS